MNSPQGPEELEGECNGGKRVCPSVPLEDTSTEPEAVPLDSSSVHMKSRDLPTEAQHTTVGSSAASLKTTGVTNGPFGASVGFNGTTMDSDVVCENKNTTLGLGGATMESSVAILQSVDDTLGCNTLGQSISAPSGPDSVAPESNHVTSGSAGTTSDSCRAPVISAGSCETVEGRSVEVVSCSNPIPPLIVYYYQCVMFNGVVE